MRAVKSVLTAAGNLKRAFASADEDILVLRSIKDVNAPKFLSHDIPLFEGITSDLFPKVELPTPDYEELLGAMRDVCERMKLQPVPSFLAKVLELHEMILVRHGLMVVGMPFAAKSSAYRVLAAALTQLFERKSPKGARVSTPALNPKSVPLGRLYGEFDVVSHEWSDGILATIFRACSTDVSETKHWMVFDGPVDAVWIESMNTVLDDNKKLCLVSGEIISMSPTMNLLFEPMDLAVASPATVSRCGMVYMEPSLLGWLPLMESWVLSLPNALMESQRASMRELMECLVPPCLWFVLKLCRAPVPTSEMGLAQNMMRLISSQLGPWRDAEGEHLDPKQAVETLQSAVVFSLIWGIGGTVDAEGRRKFDAFVRCLLKRDRPPELSNPTAPKTAVLATKLLKPLPDEGLVYDYVYDSQKRAWAGWMASVPNYAIPAGAAFHDIFVPITETVQAGHLIELLLLQGVPSLICGSTGTGKTILMRDRLLHTLPAEQFQTVFLNFSAQTSASASQSIIDGALDKRRKGVFGPQLGKKCVIFVDDLNM
eukprot:95741-Pleurochrysis_carterae.AAC.3